jgi:hypothetical protein
VYGIEIAVENFGTGGVGCQVLSAEFHCEPQYEFKKVYKAKAMLVYLQRNSVMLR